VATAVAPSLIGYYEATGQPDEVVDGVAHWYARASNFAVVSARGRAGQKLTVLANPDEYCIVLPTGASDVVVSAGSDRASAGENTLLVVPPGDSELEFVTDGWVFRVVTVNSPLYQRANDFAVEVEPAQPTAPLQAWPDPVDGFRLRKYALSDYTHLDGDQRTFRCTTMMIKLAPARNERRSPQNLSPHSHDDFEQASLVVHGSFVHHLRKPWSKDAGQWHEDEHVVAGSPSVAIIPPGVIHTSQSVGPELNQLIDIFAPPRVDFALRPGKVTNSDDYPLPDELR
jgi:mannose-6-phosphate isomerase-like protein (cupin superfamily)